MARKLMMMTSLVVAMVAALVAGCSKGPRPVAPASGSFLSVKAPLPKVRSLVASNYTFLYAVTGVGSTPVTGSVGPIPSSSVNSTYTFTINIVPANYNFIGLQMNDSATTQVLGVGGEAFTFVSGVDVPVTMGPIKTCYQANITSGDAFGFENNTTTNVGPNTPTTIPGLDMECNSLGGGYVLENAALANNTVAYLGNGDWVNYLQVPATTSFYPSSGQSKGFVTANDPSNPSLYTAAIGDVYCVQILSGGYAWLQVTSVSGGLAFNFRADTTHGFCGYEMTTADQGGCGSTPTSTPTTTPTATATDTAMFTSTNTSTLTPTNTAIFTATNTSTLTATSTSTVTGTSTATNTPTNTATLTATNTATPTATDTATVTSTNTPTNTATFTATSTQTNSPTNTATLTATNTATPTATNTATVTSTNTPTNTATFTATNTQTNSATNTATSTATNTATPTATNTATLTSTNTLTNTSTNTATSTATNSPTSTATNTLTNTATATPVSTALSGPYAVAVNNGSGDIFVTDMGNSRIVEMTSGLGFVTQWGSAGTGNGQFGNAQGIAIDGSGNIYVADHDNSRVQKFTSAGSYVTQWANTSAAAIATDGSYVYVTDDFDNVVNKFSLSGVPQNQWGGTGTGPGQFDIPSGVAVNSSGYIYVADHNNHRVQKFSPAMSFVSQWGTFGSGNGQFNHPTDVVTDALDRVYVSDASNNRIQIFDPSDLYIGQMGSFGAGAGQFNNPLGLAVNASGDLFVVDSGNNRVQKFPPIPTPTPCAVPPVSAVTSLTNGAIYYNVSGISGTASASCGSVTLVECAIHRLSDGFFWDGSAWVSSPTWVVVSGSGPWSYSAMPTWASGVTHTVQTRAHDNKGNLETPAAPVSFSNCGVPPTVNIGLPANNQAYGAVTQFNGTVGSSCAAVTEVKISVLRTGDGMFWNWGSGTWSSAVEDSASVDSFTPPNWVQFGMPIFVSGQQYRLRVHVTDNVGNTNYSDSVFKKTYAYQTQWPINANSRGIMADPSSNVYVTDFSVNKVQKFDNVGNFITQWGGTGSGNGFFFAAVGIARNSAGTTIYVSDSNGPLIQAFTPSGGFLFQWGVGGTAPGQLGAPYGMAVNSAGFVYVADAVNNRISRYNSTGSYVAQFGVTGTGPGQFDHPYGIAVNNTTGELYVTDFMNNRVQKFDAAGTYITEWGTPGFGPGQFSSPVGIAIEQGTGNVFVVDQGNSRIQKFDPNGVLLDMWGGFGTGPGQFQNPIEIAVDGSGNVYVTDQTNSRVQKFAP